MHLFNYLTKYIRLIFRRKTFYHPLPFLVFAKKKCNLLTPTWSSLPTYGGILCFFRHFAPHRFQAFTSLATSSRQKMREHSLSDIHIQIYFFNYLSTGINRKNPEFCLISYRVISFVTYYMSMRAMTD
jgi:hypothetical protein